MKEMEPESTNESKPMLADERSYPPKAVNTQFKVTDDKIIIYQTKGKTENVIVLDLNDAEALWHFLCGANDALRKMNWSFDKS